MPKAPPNKKFKQTDLLSSFKQSPVSDCYLSHPLWLATALDLGLFLMVMCCFFQKKQIATDSEPGETSVSDNVQVRL